MVTIKNETLSVKTFKAKKNATYLQCENAYQKERFPYCKNSIQDGQEYLIRICKFNNGYTIQSHYCEACMRAEFSEDEIENARGTKKAQTKDDRIEALVNDIKYRLKTYNYNDPISFEAIETSLDEIVRITKEKGK